MALGSPQQNFQSFLPQFSAGQPANGSSGIPNLNLNTNVTPNLFNLNQQQSPLSLGANFMSPETVNRPGFEFPAMNNNGNNGTQPSFFDRAFGYSTTDPTTGATQTNNGFVSPIADALGSVSNIYFGLKGLDLAEEQFDFQKGAFEKNFNASKLAFNNSVKNRADAVANATSNTDLGIGNNATAEERAAAEIKFSDGRANPRTLT